MKLTFCICFALIAYTYFGYALWLWCRTLWRKPQLVQDSSSMRVSIVIAARNEAANLPAKIQNLRQMDYPRENMEIIIVSDGSTDDTREILMQHAPEICPVILDRSNGKANALNEGVKRASGDLIVFLDARQQVDPAAVAHLAACFADPSVGAVSGELLLDSADASNGEDGLGIYWRLEKAVRKLESATGSVIGVTGAIYAIRRDCYRDLPTGTLLDDVLIPMQVARLGKRVLFQPLAIARDRLFAARGKEFSRKVRTLTGNYQLLRLAPWLISPSNPLLFRFISHKLMRLVVPLLLIVLLVSSGLAHGVFYRTVFWLQVLFYGAAALGHFVPSSARYRPVAVANTFVMLNAAAAVAFYNFIADRNNVWV
jgi:poly-beta-1,6-N-acetyl-D-glucosamine synthase